MFDFINGASAFVLDQFCNLMVLLGGEHQLLSLIQYAALNGLNLWALTSTERCRQILQTLGLDASVHTNS